MATFGQSEESRPPDTPNNHRKHNKKTKNANRISHSERDVNKNCLYQKCERSTLKNTLPKLLCLKKSPSTVRCDNNNLESFDTLCVSSLVAQSNNCLSASGSARAGPATAPTLIKCDNNNGVGVGVGDNEGESLRKSRSRNSFHQNAEEALSSLLWQPYEYRNSDEGHLDLDRLSSGGDQWGPAPGSRGGADGRRGGGGGGGDGRLSLSRAGAAVASAPGATTAATTTTRGRSGCYYEAGDMEEEEVGDGGAATATTTYRAVPASVRDVPTIRCLGNAVSNVQVLPLSGAVHGGGGGGAATLVVPVNEGAPAPPPPAARTFASVEAQTDDVVPAAAPQQQRRRERRERRHRERRDGGGGDEAAPPAPPPRPQRLPDILDSHLPPPYAAASVGVVPVQTVVPGGGGSGRLLFAGQGAQVPLVAAPPPPPPPVAAAAAHAHLPGAFRWTFAHAGFRRGRLGSESSGSSPKSCCGLRAWRPGSLRWFIALIALVAVCCVLVGTALGAARPQGRDHLTVSLLMIGVGVVLVTVSGVAWRLTAHDASLCRGGDGGVGGGWGGWGGGGGASSEDDAPPAGAGRFAPRPPPAYGRPHHPYAAMMYPEFQYRPPPPSYQASMQEYRLRLLLLDRGAAAVAAAAAAAGAGPGRTASSPPPTYRSHAGSLFRAPLCSRRDAHSDYSCPPSYRSQASSRRTAAQCATAAAAATPAPALRQRPDGAVVVGILEGPRPAAAPPADDADGPKLGPDDDDDDGGLPPAGAADDDLLDACACASKDGNLVTIVQTDDRSPVIVTVSGGVGGVAGLAATDMEILAHL